MNREVHIYDSDEMVLFFLKKAQPEYDLRSGARHCDLCTCNRQTDCVRLYCRRRHHCRTVQIITPAYYTADCNHDT